MATAAPVQPAAPRRGLEALLARHPLVSFFVMAYAFSWIVWAPLVLGKDAAGLLPINLSNAPGWVSLAFLSAAILAGPTLSAFIMTATTEGREGVRRLLGRFVLWRVGIRWYVVALVGAPLIKVLSTMVVSGEWPNLGALGGPSYLLTYLGVFVLTLIIGDRCSRNRAGAASRCPAWSGCTGRFSGRSFSASCGRVGTCPCSCRRRGPPDRAGAALSSTLLRTWSLLSVSPSFSRGCSTTPKRAYYLPSWCTLPTTRLRVC
jgi:hypothetical protein